MKQIFKCQEPMRWVLALAAALWMAGIFGASAAGDLQAETQRTIARFKQANPALQTYFDTSAGYAVFPGVGKGGLIIGGEYGKGLVFERGRLIGEAKLKEASIGAQAGGESFDQVIFFQTPEALEEFKHGKNLVDAQLHGVAAAQGQGPGFEQHAKYVQGVAVFVLPREGLMGQASIGGQRFEFMPYTSPER